MLPIYEIIPKLKSVICKNMNLVLQAPPGAGKTTVVPLELLNEAWLANKKILMLEPRRLAARAAAHRMAQTLGENVGETVGYRVRMDQKIGPKTRIEVVTEGVLIRKLQSDPELSDVGLIIFDEFHERSIEADLGLALSLDVQEGLRDDLKIMIMSATLDGAKVATLMDNCPVVSSEGRSFHVEHHYFSHSKTKRVEEQTAELIQKAIKEEQGSILVFLPGAGEIERTKSILEQKSFGADIIICPLYGMMSFRDQDLAIQPQQAGKRKIVLATAIAETSLTIEGIRIVIDSGLSRSAAYDVRSGMTRLITQNVSKASADQRAGRAGRIEDGICYRLWSEQANRALKPYTEAEINKVDLVPLALDLAQWGIDDASSLRWLDEPDKISIASAKELLFSLGALDETKRITKHGTLMARFPMHPRLAHMILKADQLGHGSLALSIAALLEDRDILNLKPELRTADLRLRIEALNHIKNGETKEARYIGCNISAAKNILRQVKIWQRTHRIKDQAMNIDMAGLCLSIAFPDRIGGMRSLGAGSYLLSGGRGAKLRDDDPLIGEKFLAIGHLDKGGRDARIFLSAPISKEHLQEHFFTMIEAEKSIEWDDRNQIVKSEVQQKLGYMPISISKIDKPEPADVKEAMIKGLLKMGLSVLPWDKKSLSLCKRSAMIREYCDEGFADLSEKTLRANLENWLGPYLDGISNRANLSKIDLYSILKNILSWEQQQQLERLAPTHIKVPSGSNISIDYDVDPPVLSVKLQEMFGAIETPKILNGKCALSVHLLSPARRPLQITSDVAGFWKNSYPEIKKEMKGRYPKHPWPDDPFLAIATRKLKPKK